MIVIILRFRVADYDRWLAVFLSRDPLRRQAGCLARRVLRDAKNPHQVAVVLDWDSAGNYDAFAKTGMAQTAEGRERVGILGEPEELRFNEEPSVVPWEDQR